MTTTKKMLLAFVLTVLLVISSVHCSDDTRGFGITEKEKRCFTPYICTRGEQYCQVFCAGLSSVLVGKCISGICCCFLNTK
ncbi:hypothetical protein ISN45_Aa02g007120 [Arabidopsis thaliana x Arabidopsis arenosa]|uniref:Uncharacterized protein n=1 Tax=Arabidopsis thaliana x Arabidopsis arenosa TaxID=1240361 RepID=A0A8T2BIR4_9BRAS|nr:hypothetical protein ISN45_Aa02g007120 [Arabidopsis thaliana x Arabidopsis arenosa]